MLLFLIGLSLLRYTLVHTFTGLISVVVGLIFGGVCLMCLPIGFSDEVLDF